jgi:hypothetical protein
MFNSQIKSLFFGFETLFPYGYYKGEKLVFQSLSMCHKQRILLCFTT